MFSLNEHINLDVWETTQQISAAKAKASELSLEERKTVSHVIYLVNHRLLMDLPKLSSCEVSSLYKAFWVAAILYLHLIIREIPRMARIHLPLTERLQLSVKRAFATQAIEGDILGFVVWIIFLGER
jgi:galactitol-specific phosphotransferase system IIC component